jgi:hypothetical protein
MSALYALRHDRQEEMLQRTTTATKVVTPAGRGFPVLRSDTYVRRRGTPVLRRDGAPKLPTFHGFVIATARPAVATRRPPRSDFTEL